MRSITWQLVSSLLLNGFSFCTVDASATVLSIRTEELKRNSMKPTRIHQSLCLLLIPFALEAQSPSTWNKIQQKILNQNCITCHVAGSFFATQSGLTLTSDSAYIKLVNVRPRNYAAAADSLVRVSSIGGLVGLVKSYIWEKLDASNQAHFYTAHPNYGALMPLDFPISPTVNWHSSRTGSLPELHKLVLLQTQAS